eukprot:CAMPEP_0194445002 /NCGR_PEP_ID=MMETSP0176-20130528/127608_1 /TAXON_ID=216777 /ORGANISM="Proboscia alata, Strain PI-D3" /LENGTH=31 /DNA_ID= /DNA_START= /DNA_END= /DNA_ORIENTATION=
MGIFEGTGFGKSVGSKCSTSNEPPSGVGICS